MHVFVVPIANDRVTALIRAEAQGALDMELKREAAIGKKRICISNPAPTREATLTEFVGWVRALPKNQALPATDGLFTFLSERFPCK